MSRSQAFRCDLTTDVAKRQIVQNSASQAKNLNYWNAEIWLAKKAVGQKKMIPNSGLEQEQYRERKWICTCWTRSRRT